MKNTPCSRFLRVSFLLPVLFLAAGLSFLSCERSGKVVSLEEKAIFSLGYGNFENQLNVFDLTSVSRSARPSSCGTASSTSSTARPAR